jgi:hypothetical protein
MGTSEELREQSRLYRQAAMKEDEALWKKRLARHALALAVIAERIEREEAETKALRLRLMRDGFSGSGS